MKRPFKSLSLYLCIGLCAGLSFTGCTSDSLTGPDLQRSETNGAPVQGHNNGDKNGAPVQGHNNGDKNGAPVQGHNNGD